MSWGNLRARMIEKRSVNGEVAQNEPIWECVSSGGNSIDRKSELRKMPR